MNTLIFFLECGYENTDKCDKVFKNGPSKICEEQPLKNFTWSILEYFDSNNPWQNSIIWLNTIHEKRKIPLYLKSLSSTQNAFNPLSASVALI